MCIYVATKGTSFSTLLRMAGPSAVRRVAWISPSTSKGRLAGGLIFRVGGFFVSVQVDLWHILGSWNLWKQIESPSVHCYFAPWFQHVSVDTKVSGNCGCSSRWRQLCPVKICILVWNWRHGTGKVGKVGKVDILCTLDGHLQKIPQLYTTLFKSFSQTCLQCSERFNSRIQFVAASNRKKRFPNKIFGLLCVDSPGFSEWTFQPSTSFSKKKHRYHFPWIDLPLPHTHTRKTSILNSKNGWFGWMFRLFHFGDLSRKDYVHLPAAAKRVVQLSVAAIRQVDPRSFRQKMLRRSLLFVGDFP